MARAKPAGLTIDQAISILIFRCIRGIKMDFLFRDIVREKQFANDVSARAIKSHQ